VRHANAERRDGECLDFDRALTKKGVKAAHAMARRLRKGGFAAEHMISSPAARALETARVFAKELKYPVKRIELCPAIYDAADTASLMSIIQSTPESASTVLMFGHDPSFSELARHLLPDFGGALPKGAVVTVEFDADTWAGLDPRHCRLLSFEDPTSKRDKARRKKSAGEELAAVLAEVLDARFRALDPQAAEKIKPYALKSIREVASRFLKHSSSLNTVTQLAEDDHEASSQTETEY
jgi:phosphohistidine phosphatase